MVNIFGSNVKQNVEICFKIKPAMPEQFKKEQKKRIKNKKNSEQMCSC